MTIELTLSRSQLKIILRDLAVYHEETLEAAPLDVEIFPSPDLHIHIKGGQLTQYQYLYPSRDSFEKVLTKSQRKRYLKEVL